MDVTAYLDRIQYRGALMPSHATLAELHQAHLRSVPFENLDIHLGIPIVLELDRLFEKIVCQKRGGFCYELNGLFAALLESLGFRVARLSARVSTVEALGPEFDHLTLAVECPADNDGVRWLADVGFGDCFLSPLQLDERGDQEDDVRAYRIDHDGDYRWLWQRDYDGVWSQQYRFTFQPHTLAEFAPMCEWMQTSPESSFTQRRVITRVTLDGRVTLRDDRCIITTRGLKHEEPVADDADYRRRLRELFDVDVRDRAVERTV